MRNDFTTYFYIDKKHLNCVIKALEMETEYKAGEIADIQEVTMSLMQLRLEFKDVLSAMYFGIWYERARINYELDAVKSTE